MACVRACVRVCVCVLVLFSLFSHRLIEHSCYNIFAVHVDSVVTEFHLRGNLDEHFSSNGAILEEDNNNNNNETKELRFAFNFAATCSFRYFLFASVCVCLCLCVTSI